jgi:hypothetical protein
MKLLRGKKPLTRHRRQSDDADTMSSNVSYYSHRADQELNVGRKLERKEQQKATSAFRSIWLQRTALFAGSIIVLIAAFRLLSLNSNAIVRLENTDTSGLFFRNQSGYTATTQKILASSWWDKNKVTINAVQLQNDLTAQYPEITSVSIDLSFLSERPIVYIQISEPSLIINDLHGSYILDDSGKVLTSNSTYLAYSSLNLPLLTDQSGLTLERNRQALPSDDVSFIQTVVAQLNAKSIKIYAMTLPPGGSELDVQPVSAPYFIKFNLENDDPRQQVGTFLAAEANLSSQHITPAKYIDVRVDGRAYYQ